MRIFPITLLLVAMSVSAQTKKLKTDQYQGVYQYEKEGTLVIIPQTDDTVVFFLSINVDGKTGTMYEQLRIQNGKGHFCKKFKDTESDCRIDFDLTQKVVRIASVQGSPDCGFGFGIYADGDYIKKSENAKKFMASIAPGLVMPGRVNNCK
jgi:hypothetical protein